MSIKTIGTFVLRSEGNGCLSGKYKTNEGNDTYPEACKAKTPIEEDGFCGTYHSVWIQEDGQVEKATLKIRKNDKNNGYVLNWYINIKSGYTGAGMLIDNFLVGTYWSNS